MKCVIRIFLRGSRLPSLILVPFLEQAGFTSGFLPWVRYAVKHETLLPRWLYNWVLLPRRLHRLDPGPLCLLRLDGGWHRSCDQHQQGRPPQKPPVSLFGLLASAAVIYPIAARELNERRIPYPNGTACKYWNVAEIVRNPKYAGCATWGRTSQRLHGPTARIPKQQWTHKDRAFGAIVSPRTFERVQLVLDNKLLYSDQEMLDRLRRLLERYGKLSEAILRRSKIARSASQYRRRFGSLSRAYELIGYEQKLEDFCPSQQRRNSEQLRDQVAEAIADKCAGQVRLQRRNLKCRPYLITAARVQVSVLICPRSTTLTGDARWSFYPHPREQSTVILAGAVGVDERKLCASFLLPGATRRRIMKGLDEFRTFGVQLQSLADFPAAVLECFQHHRAAPKFAAARRAPGINRRCKLQACRHLCPIIAPDLDPTRTPQQAWLLCPKVAVFKKRHTGHCGR